MATEILHVDRGRLTSHTHTHTHTYIQIQAMQTSTHRLAQHKCNAVISCQYIQTHIHTQAHTHIHINTQAHTHIHTQAHTHMHTWMYHPGEDTGSIRRKKDLLNIR